MQLKRQVVLITGCSSGIGRAMAEAFKNAGCSVYASARSIERLSDLAGVEKLQLDVNQPGQIKEALAQIKEGQIDILINNAGFGCMGPLSEMPLENFRAQLETNLVAPLAMIQACLPLMNPGACIVNIGSCSGILPSPFSGAYCASKAGLHAMDHALRIELRPFGIRLITLQPGAIQSAFGDNSSAGLAWLKRSRYDSRKVMMRAAASQDRPTPAGKLAARLIRELGRKNPRANLRYGYGSLGMPLLSRLPIGLRDLIMDRRFGLPRGQKKY